MNQATNVPTVDSEEYENEFQQEAEALDEGELQVDQAAGRVSVEKSDRSLAEFHRWYRAGRLILDPEWQREYVWDNKRASKLIESILVDIPVPVIYLAKSEDNTYEVIDGLQRLNSIFRFINNELSLGGLEVLRDYNGKKFKDLPQSVQRRLEDATLRAFELQPQTHKDLMFLIFERLNTGGKPLNDMEIRNCLYRGQLNNLIKELAHDSNFTQAVHQANISKRMGDRLLVLRFLAFYERTYSKAKSGLKRFLNEFFETYRNPTPDKLKEFEREFRDAMRASVTVFGDQAFRIRRDSQSGVGEWAPRVNASVFQAISVSFTDYNIGQLTRRADAIYEEYVDLISTDTYWLDCVRSATGDFARIDYVFRIWRQRLKLAIGDEAPNDSARLFTRALKEQLYQQDPTCRICNQRISLMMDAALDHDRHYWRGGKTIPENARLVHRQCNLERSQ